MFELSRTKMAAVVPSWHGGAQHAVWETSSHYVWFRIPQRESEEWYDILNYIDMYWCFVNFSSVNSCNSPWTMKLSSELCWSSPWGLPLAAPAYTAAIRTLGRRLCWHEALWREAPLPSFSFLFSFLLFHTISGCFCTLHSTMQDVNFGSFLICTFCIPLTGEAGSSLKSPAPDTKGQERWKQIYINIEIVIES